MTPQEKLNMIGVLEMVTGYSYEYLRSLSEDKLEQLYKEKVG